MNAASGPTDRRAWLWLTPGVALLGFLFRDLARGMLPAGADVGLYSLPRFQLLARLWRGGLAPGWNPYLGLGSPMVGDPTLGFFYPGNALVLLASPGGALAAYLTLHLALGLAGTFALARKLGMRPPSASLVAMAFSLGGISLGQLHTPIYVAACGWLPWALLGFLRHVERPSFRGAWVAALPFAMMFLAGAPENTVLAGLLALACAPLVGASAAAAALHLLGVAAAAMGLAGAGLVPALYVYEASDRGAGFPLELSARWSLHPLELLGLLLPRAFHGDTLTPAAVGQPFRVWHASLYMGVATCACLLPGLPALWRRPAARPLLGLGAGLLLLAFGTAVWPSPFAWAHRWLPGVSSFRYPAKLFVPVSLILALAAGFGVEAARRGDGRRALGAGCVALAVGSATLGALGLAGGVPGVALHAAVPLGGALAALAALRWAPRPRLWQLLLTLLALDLGLAGDRLTSFVPGQLFAQRPWLVGAVWDRERAGGRPERVVTDPAAFQARVDAPGLELSQGAREQLSWREALYPNTGMPFGLRCTDAFTSLRAARRLAFRRAATQRDLSLDRAARLLGASLVVGTRDGPEDYTARGGPLASSGPFALFELERAPPWAAVYVEGQGFDEPARALDAVLAPGFDPGRSCVWEGGGISLQGRAEPVPAELAAADWDELVLRVETPAGGLLVVREAYAAGWRAEVDGEPQPLLPADYLYRGVRIPPGPHVVRLHYAQRGRRAGVWLSVLCVVLLLGVAVAGRPSRRRDCQNWTPEL